MSRVSGGQNLQLRDWHQESYTPGRLPSGGEAFALAGLGLRRVGFGGGQGGSCSLVSYGGPVLVRPHPSMVC